MEAPKNEHFSAETQDTVRHIEAGEVGPFA